MTDKEKLDLLEDYVMSLLNSRISLQLRKGRFGMSLNRFNKVDCAHLEGEIEALDRIRDLIENRLRKGETE
jgi:hypothetical protein